MIILPDVGAEGDRKAATAIASHGDVARRWGVRGWGYSDAVRGAIERWRGARRRAWR